MSALRFEQERERSPAPGSVAAILVAGCAALL
jgi:hypothetical protein